MARAVVLYFELNQDADDFVKELDSGAEFAGSILREWVDDVVGIYPVPTQFCDPTDPIHKGKGKTGRGFARGKKYGWWVCAVCMKPYRAKTKDTLVRSVIGQSVNLLPDVRGVEADPKVQS